jgi:hypothetical protein
MTTAQEIFDTVATHLRTMSRRAMSTDGTSCVYLNGETGERCAIGALLPAEIVSADWPEMPVDELIDTHPEVLPYIWPEDMADQYDGAAIATRFLTLLQNVHDTASNWFDRGEDSIGFVGEIELQDIAHSYHLDYTGPKKYTGPKDA